MKALILALLLFTSPAYSWSICETGYPDSCMTEAELKEKYPTDEELDAQEAEQEELNEIVTIFNDQIWIDDYPVLDW